MNLGTDATEQIRKRMAEREFRELPPEMWESREKTIGAALEGLMTGQEVDDNTRWGLVMLLIKLYAETLSAELEVASQQIKKGDTEPDTGEGGYL